MKKLRHSRQFLYIFSSGEIANWVNYVFRNQQIESSSITHIKHFFTNCYNNIFVTNTALQYFTHLYTEVEKVNFSTREIFRPHETESAINTQTAAKWQYRNTNYKHIQNVCYFILYSSYTKSPKILYNVETNP